MYRARKGRGVRGWGVGSGENREGDAVHPQGPGQCLTLGGPSGDTHVCAGVRDSGKCLPVPGDLLSKILYAAYRL